MLSLRSGTITKQTNGYISERDTQTAIFRLRAIKWRQNENKWGIMGYELTRKNRAAIEWHFKNYAANLALRQEREAEIIESGLTGKVGKIGGSSGISDPTADKAVKLIDAELDKIFSYTSTGDWAAVVRNTFTAFKFTPEFEIMKKIYIEKMTYRQLFGKKFPQAVFWRWRDKWLIYAYKNAKEYELL